MSFLESHDWFTMMYLFNHAVWDRLCMLEWASMRETRHRQLKIGLSYQFAALRFVVPLCDRQGDPMALTMLPRAADKPFRCTLYHAIYCNPLEKCSAVLTGRSPDFAQTIGFVCKNTYIDTQVGLYYDRASAQFGIVQAHWEKRLYHLPLSPGTLNQQLQQSWSARYCVIV